MRCGKLLLKQRSQFFHQPPRGAVDDAASRLHSQPVQQCRIFFRFVIQAAAGIGQVGTVEAGDVHLRAAQLQHVNDVVAHVRRRGRRQRHGRRRTQLLAHLGQAHVLRTKIVSPEAEAVGFVHHQQAGPKLRQQPLKRGRGETFRREIQQSVEARLSWLSTCDCSADICELFSNSTGTPSACN